MTPIDIVLEKHRLMKEQTKLSNEYTISKLEDEMDGLDMENDENAQQRMEEICNQIANLEEEEEEEEDSSKNDDNENGEIQNIMEQARDALSYFGIPESTFDSILIERPQLLLLDEPTCHNPRYGINVNKKAADILPA